jgi:phospholipase C
VTEETFASKPWQAKVSRRRFLGTGAALASAAALAGYLPETVLKAAAAPAPTSFDLSQIKHLVFLMQENRSFDHYFGTYPGARGFSDPTAITLPTGRSVFQQPDPANPDTYLEPWHMSTVTSGAAAVPSLSHDWRAQHASLNHGANDGWVRTHIASDSPARGPFTLGYYTEQDIPFHWAMAQAFTLADNYHCSVLGPTTPNRLFWQSGSNDPQGLNGGPILETAATPPLTYQSAAETLFEAGISYKFYWNSAWDITSQAAGSFAPWRGAGGPAALINSEAAFGTLFGDGTPGGIGNPANPTTASNPDLAFEQDVANGVLPDVCFLGSGAGADEHPPEIPAGGAAYLASKLDALASNEDLWNTTVFIINYDENDGFFDHVVPPTPNQDEYPEEFVTKPSPISTPGGGFPVGAGFRVPAWVISPWSVGGKLFSTASDHTSGLQFIEAVAAAGGLSGKAPVTFPNVSRWRRATFSDWAGALQPGSPQAAPSSTQFSPATTAANLAAQQASAKLPLPPFPGAAQTMPAQLS